MLGTLFSPKGRIGSAEFLKALLVIGVLGAILTLIPMFNFELGQMLQLVNIVLLVSLIFVLIKRCHDAGKTGWMSIAFLVLLIVVSLIVQNMVGNMTGGQAMTDMQAAMQELGTSGAGFAEIMAESKDIAKQYAPEVAKNTAVPSAIANIVTLLVVGYLINLILKSDPNENKFGPPTQ